MHIQLLSFKILCLSQRLRTIRVLEFKSTAASWNGTLSCLFMSLPLWLAEPYYVVTLLGTAILFVYCMWLAELYHVVPHKLLNTLHRNTRVCNHSRCPRAWNLSQYCFIFYTIQTPVGWLMIANICTSLYTSGVLLSWKTKNEFVFPPPHQIVNTCDLHLVKCTILAHWSYQCRWLASFNNLLNFKIKILKI